MIRSHIQLNIGFMHITGQTDTLEFWILIGFYPFLLKTSFGIFFIRSRAYSDLSQVFTVCVYLKGWKWGGSKICAIG